MNTNILLRKLSESYWPLTFHKKYLQYLDDNNIIAEADRTTLRRGFRKPVAGFRYEGGRMSQRACFDTMKDYVHLSEKGQGFNPTLRFSIPDFGVMTETQFLRLNNSIIHDRIKFILNELTE